MVATTQKSKKGYTEKEKQETIRYYIKGIEFRIIERLLGMSRNSTINLTKQEAEKLKKSNSIFVFSFPPHFGHFIFSIVVK